MSEKVGKEAIMDAIEHMTVLELAELVKELEQKFGVTAAAPVAMLGAVQAGGAEKAAQEEEQTEFTVTLESAGNQKIQVIKEVRAITGLGLKEAKALVDEAPKVVKDNIPKAEAEDIKQKLEKVGAGISIK